MPLPSSTATGTHLTTSRINRILRPLKTKCAALASVMRSPGVMPTGGVEVTYGPHGGISRTNSSSSSPDEFHPLAVLPPPEQVPSSRSLQKRDMIRNQLSLSKNIYGIRDTLKNVINLAFEEGSRSAGPATAANSSAATSERHVVSLAGLCAIVVGRELAGGQVGGWGDAGKSTDDESDGDYGEEDTRKWVDGIYEAIPFHIRGTAVVSHALQIILRSCPPHPTLLFLLLELLTKHSHSFKMIPLAENILRSLIFVSFTSSSNPSAISPLPPPICHVAHRSFLTSLLSLWRNSSFGDSERFLSILLEVSPYGVSDAWTSRALSDLAAELSKENFSSLVRMTARLVEIVTQSRHRTSKGGWPSGELRIALLLRWLKKILNQLVHTDYIEGDTEFCLRCLELMSVYYGSGLGTRVLVRGEKRAKEVDDIMINITTWFLAFFPPSFSPVEDSKRLIRFLRRCDARPAVFTPLITRFFNSVSDDEVPWEMLDQLHRFASALQSNELYKLELSMVEQIQEEFQSVFLETLGFEPEYDEIMRDLQISIENAEMAI